MGASFSLELVTGTPEPAFGEVEYVDFTIKIAVDLAGSRLVSARIVDEDGAYAPLHVAPDGRLTVNALGLRPGYATLEVIVVDALGNLTPRGFTVVVWPDVERPLTAHPVRHRARAVVLEHLARAYVIAHDATATNPDLS